MYCVKCGVRLSDGARACPLCGTPVMSPDAAKDAPEIKKYPDEMPRHYSDVDIPAVIFATVFFALDRRLL